MEKPHILIIGLSVEKNNPGCKCGAVLKLNWFICFATCRFECRDGWTCFENLKRMVGMGMDFLWK